MAKPVDPLERCVLDIVDPSPRAACRITSVMQRPMTDSATALSYALPLLKQALQNGVSLTKSAAALAVPSAASSELQL